MFGRIVGPGWFFAGDLLVERRVRPVRIQGALPRDKRVEVCTESTVLGRAETTRYAWALPIVRHPLTFILSA